MRPLVNRLNLFLSDLDAAFGEVGAALAVQKFEKEFELGRLSHSDRRRFG